MGHNLIVTDIDITSASSVYKRLDNIEQAYLLHILCYIEQHLGICYAMMSW